MHSGLGRPESEALLLRFAKDNGIKDADGVWLMRPRDASTASTEWILSIIFQGRPSHHLFQLHPDGKMTVNGKHLPPNVRAVPQALDYLNTNAPPFWPVRLRAYVPSATTSRPVAPAAAAAAPAPAAAAATSSRSVPIAPNPAVTVATSPARGPAPSAAPAIPSGTVRAPVRVASLTSVPAHTAVSIPPSRDEPPSGMYIPGRDGARGRLQTFGQSTADADDEARLTTEQVDALLRGPKMAISMVRAADESFGFSVVEGRPPRVNNVVPCSIAQVAGLQRGDFLVSIQYQPTVDMRVDEWQNLLHSCGNNINFLVARPLPPPGSRQAKSSSVRSVRGLGDYDMQDSRLAQEDVFPEDGYYTDE